MKKYLIVYLTAVVVMAGCTSTKTKEVNLISKINKEMSFSPTAFGDVGNEKLETLPVNDLSSIKLKYPPRDQNGWTILTPSEDSRLMYVSSSEGDDDTALAYNVSEVDNVFDPSNVSAFKTILAARKLTRDGYPDWILLKKGDEWVIDKRLESYSGRSASEPMVLTSYSTDSDRRPLIKTKGVEGFKVVKKNSFYSIVGLEFYAYERDPNSNDFIGWDNVGNRAGFVSASSDKTPQIPESIVLEDNVFNFYALNISFTGKAGHKDIIVRRNQLLNAYSTVSHAQGVFVQNANVIFEENLMDHNGWFQKSYVKLNSKSEGQATFYNHNAYFSGIYNSVIVNNISSRSSSIGMKFSSNANKSTGINSIESYNLLIENNLIIEGEVGLSLGGNVDFNNGFRWGNINVLNNVFLNIGHSQPTSRVLAWGIEANDWDRGVILGNYILFNDNPEVINVKGVIIKGLNKNIAIDSNVMYKIRSREGRYI